MMLIKNLVELMRSGISERSSARVQAETEVSMADESTEKADNRTLVRDAALTSMGTKTPAEELASATKAIDMIVPRTPRNVISVYERLIREVNVREAVSLMMTQAARGRPSFNTSATNPVYVDTSVVTTIVLSMFATRACSTSRREQAVRMHTG